MPRGPRRQRRHVGDLVARGPLGDSSQHAAALARGERGVRVDDVDEVDVQRPSGPTPVVSSGASADRSGRRRSILRGPLAASRRRRRPRRCWTRTRTPRRPRAGARTSSNVSTSRFPSRLYVTGLRPLVRRRNTTGGSSGDVRCVGRDGRLIATVREEGPGACGGCRPAGWSRRPAPRYVRNRGGAESNVPRVKPCPCRNRPPTSRSTRSTSAGRTPGSCGISTQCSPSCGGRPISWHHEPEIDTPGIEVGPGFWALTRYDDVMHVSRDPDVFLSARDQHRRHPARDRRVARLDDQHGRAAAHEAAPDREPRVHAPPGREDRADRARRRRARSSTRSPSSGECDFVSEIAAALPLADHLRHARHPARRHQRIFELTNIDPRRRRPRVRARRSKSSWPRAWSCSSTGMSSRRTGSTTRATTSPPRSCTPRSTTRTAAQADAGELGSFFLLLVVAGNETTRNAISHGMLALTRPPRPAALWIADFDGVSPTAVEEIVRWATPVIHFRRTAVARMPSSAARRSRPARRSCMFYNSANRDERRVRRSLPLRRAPRTQRALRLRRRRPALLPGRQPRPPRDPGDVRGAVPPPARHRDQRRARHAPVGFIHGIKRMPCAYTPS